MAQGVRQWGKRRVSPHFVLVHTVGGDGDAAADRMLVP